MFLTLLWLTIAFVVIAMVYTFEIQNQSFELRVQDRNYSGRNSNEAALHAYVVTAAARYICRTL